MTIQELIVECIEALSPCENTRKTHQQHIREALENQKDYRIREVLQQFEERFASYEHADIWKRMELGRSSTTLEKEIRESISHIELPRYVYHGTVVGHLQSIYQKGLVPGEVHVWKGPTDRDTLIRQHSDAGVFFSERWRVAMHQWAFAAHRHSRGPKNSVKRSPAVIRIKRDGLALQCDAVAANQSLMVKGIVHTRDAEVITGFDTAFPQWQPLEELVRTVS